MVWTNGGDSGRDFLEGCLGSERSPLLAPTTPAWGTRWLGRGDATCCRFRNGRKHCVMDPGAVHANLGNPAVVVSPHIKLQANAVHTSVFRNVCLLRRMPINELNFIDGQHNSVHRLDVRHHSMWLIATHKLLHGNILSQTHWDPACHKPIRTGMVREALLEVHQISPTQEASARSCSRRQLCKLSSSAAFRCLKSRLLSASRRMSLKKTPVLLPYIYFYSITTLLATLCLM